MTGLYGLRLVDLVTPGGQHDSRRKLAAIGHDLHRGRIFAVPWYEINIVGTHGFTTMTRPIPGGSIVQGIVAPCDLALICYGYNFVGPKTAGNMQLRLQVDGVNTEWEEVAITSNDDHGQREIDFEADIIPQGALWTVQNSTSGFTPGTTDVEVWSYLAPV